MPLEVTVTGIRNLFMFYGMRSLGQSSLRNARLVTAKQIGEKIIHLAFKNRKRTYNSSRFLKIRGSILCSLTLFTVPPKSHAV